MPDLIIRNISDQNIPAGTPIVLLPPEQGKPQMGEAWLPLGKKALIQVEVRNRTCEQDGHSDPDNSGMCIYCGVVLDE